MSNHKFRCESNPPKWIISEVAQSEFGGNVESVIYKPKTIDIHFKPSLSDKEAKQLRQALKENVNQSIEPCDK